MQSVRSNGGYLKICSSLLKQRKGVLIFCSSLIRNSSLFPSSEFGRVVVKLLSSQRESKHEGIIPTCYYGHIKPI